MTSLDEKLNAHLADWNILYTKLHHYHWYVTGPHFPSLHAKFEELYGFAGEALDEFAERILSTGGKPISSLKQYLEKATLKEAGKESTDEEMLEAAIADFRKLANGLKATQQEAEKAGDAVTADMLTEYAGKLEKQTWMLSATAKRLVKS